VFHVDHDGFTLTFNESLKPSDVENAVNKLRQRDVASLWPAVDPRAVEGLKFSECLPMDLALEMLASRLKDGPAVTHVLQQALRCVSVTQ
jgi:ATP-dependent Lhr-like helicase